MIRIKGDGAEVSQRGGADVADFNAAKETWGIGIGATRELTGEVG